MKGNSKVNPFSENRWLVQTDKGFSWIHPGDAGDESSRVCPL